MQRRHVATRAQTRNAVKKSANPYNKIEFFNFRVDSTGKLTVLLTLPTGQKKVNIDTEQLLCDAIKLTTAKAIQNSKQNTQNPAPQQAIQPAAQPQPMEVKEDATPVAQMNNNSTANPHQGSDSSRFFKQTDGTSDQRLRDQASGRFISTKSVAELKATRAYLKSRQMA